MNKHSKISVIGSPAFNHKALNPYTNLLYSAVTQFDVSVIEFSIKTILFSNYDIVHLHWPEWYLSKKNTVDALLKTIFIFLLLLVAKFRGAKIIWTAHNLAPHNTYHPNLILIFWKIFPLILDGLIGLNPSTYALVLKAHPSLRKVKSFAHQYGIGHYKGIYPNNITKEQARKTLSLEKTNFVFLFVGNISPYKNVKQLADCFTDVSDKDSILLIAGQPSTDIIAQELINLAKQDSRIRLTLDFIPDDQLQVFLNAADIVVFPFTNMLNSSSALLALSFNKPILFPSISAMDDLRKLVGENWIHLYHGELSAEILLLTKEKKQTSNITNVDLSSMDWEKIANETVLFYRSILE